MTDIKILQEMLKVEPLPARDESKRIKPWPEVEKLIDKSEHDVEGTTNVKRLMNYLIAAIEDLPQKGAIKKRKQTVKLAGKVWSHLILNGNTYSNGGKGEIRTAIKNHFFGGDYKAGEDFLRDPDVKFDDSERTKRVNAVGEAKSEKRQENAVEISAERVEKIVEQMKADLDSGNSKYDIVAILLGDLCLGSRWVESLMFSKFEADKEEKETGWKKVPTKWVKQTGIAKKFNRGIDNRKASVYKPCLPYIDADYVVDHIYAFRDAHPALKAKQLNYNSDNKADVRLANQFRYKANKLVQKRYFPGMLTRAEAKAIQAKYDKIKLERKLTKAEEAELAKSNQRASSSHLLRAIWANVSYELFRKKGQAKDKYVKDTLGHDSYSPGIRYKDVMVVKAEDDDALADLTFAPVGEAELKQPADMNNDELNDDVMEEADDNMEPEQGQEQEQDQAPQAPQLGDLQANHDQSSEIAQLRAEVRATNKAISDMRGDMKLLTSLIQRLVLGQEIPIRRRAVAKKAEPKPEPEPKEPDQVVRRSSRLKK